MRKSLIPVTGVAALACLLSFTSCKRDRVVFDGEIYSAIDNGFAESEFTAIRNMVDVEGRADSNVYGKTSGTTGLYCPGAVVTVTLTSATTAEMQIDFGSGSNCMDGRLRTGKINASFVGKWKDAGSYVDISPEDYTVSGYALTFDKRITYNGENGQNQPYWTTEVTNAVLTNSEGSRTWNCTRVTTWVAGSGDLDATNNVYEVTGTANGTSRQGVAYDAVVDADSPLRIEASCQYIVSGAFRITPSGRETRTIDYGGGTCDNQATLSVGTYTGNITLP